MVDQLIALFDGCFYERYNTRLIRGEAEPIYYPADDDFSYHRIIFAHGFFRSALHEVAHWCVAGQQRRLQTDYGYWYVADGRDAQQQQHFEAVEFTPQALEWLFCKASASRFSISADNLQGEPTDTSDFKRAVYQQVLLYCEQGLTGRIAQFHEALVQCYNPGYVLDASHFSLEEL